MVFWELDVIVIGQYYIIRLVIKHINDTLNCLLIFVDLIYKVLHVTRLAHEIIGSLLKELEPI